MDKTKTDKQAHTWLDVVAVLCAGVGCCYVLLRAAWWLALFAIGAW